MAALVGAFAEPLLRRGNDAVLLLHTGHVGRISPHSTSHNRSGHTAVYVVLYAAPAIYIAHQIARRHDDPPRAVRLGPASRLIESAAFEIIGNQRRVFTVTGGHHVIPDLPVPIGHWCTRSRSGDCPSRVAAIAAARPPAPLSGQLLGPLRACFPCHVFSWPTSARAWPNHHRQCISSTPRRH